MSGLQAPACAAEDFNTKSAQPPRPLEDLRLRHQCRGMMGHTSCRTIRDQPESKGHIGLPPFTCGTWVAIVQCIAAAHGSYGAAEAHRFATAYLVAAAQGLAAAHGANEAHVTSQPRLVGSPQSSMLPQPKSRWRQPTRTPQPLSRCSPQGRSSEPSRSPQLERSPELVGLSQPSRAAAAQSGRRRLQPMGLP